MFNHDAPTAPFTPTGIENGEPQTIDELMKLLAEKPEEHFALTTDDSEPTDETAEEPVLN